MTPQQMLNAAYQIQRRWPDAVIYPNACCKDRNPGVPQNAWAVDVDQSWIDDEGELCGAGFVLVAWIDLIGEIHYADSIAAASGTQ